MTGVYSWRWPGALGLWSAGRGLQEPGVVVGQDHVVVGAAGEWGSFGAGLTIAFLSLEFPFLTFSPNFVQRKGLVMLLVVNTTVASNCLITSSLFSL